MTAVCVLIADRTACPTQSPTAIRWALVLSSRLESPTEFGSTALCTAFSACSRETSAVVQDCGDCGLELPELVEVATVPGPRAVGGVDTQLPAAFLAGGRAVRGGVDELGGG